MNKAEKSARMQGGDGKLPNLYWVSTADDWLECPDIDSNTFDWAHDIHKNLPQADGETFGPFKTFAEAEAKAEKLQHNDLVEIGTEGNKMVTIEDRLSGVIYEGVYSVWHTKQGPYTITHIEWDWRDDTGYTREKLGSTFQ